MKILFVFIDMIRPNRLSSFNEHISTKTPIDEMLSELGGTYYTNSFSQGPDTPRGMATFATGEIPYKNGCDTRVKWPRYFLNPKIKTIYDIFIENNYKLTFFSNPNERETGIFPENIASMDIHNSDYDLDGYLSNIELKEDHCVFVGIPDFHWSFDDNGYTVSGERQAFIDTKETVDIIFDVFNKDDFDHIFVFSDHGYKFSFESKKQPRHYLLNEDRARILMLHRKKGENLLIENDKLCSIADMYSTVEELFNGKVSKGVSFLSENERAYIVIEDHMQFAPSVNQNIEIWSVVERGTIYIRTLEDGYLLNRNTGTYSQGKIATYDEILKNETSFKQYIYEYEKVFRYRDFLFRQTAYMHGGERKRIHKLKNYLNLIKDYVVEGE